MGDWVVEAVTGGLEVFDRLGDEWRDLLDRVGTDSPYWRPEWVRASLRAFAPQAKVVVFTARREGTLSALLPLIEERGTFARLPARKLRAPLTTAGVGVDVLCSESGADHDAAIAAIWKAIQKRKGWDVMELPSVLEDTALTRLCELGSLQGHPRGSWTVPLIAFFAIPQGPTALKDLEKYPRHPKLRSKVRQRENKLAALGAVRLRRTEKDGAADLQIFYQMEAAGWKGKEGSAIISDPRTRQFFDEVVRESERFGHLCLYTLEVDSKPIASHIGFTYRGRYWAAKSTYDESYRDYAPGHVIVKAILRDCAERGVTEYVMGVREDWKMEWTQDVRKRSYQCLFNRGVWPRLLYTLRFPLRSRFVGLKNRLQPGKRAAGEESSANQTAAGEGQP